MYITNKSRSTKLPRALLSLFSVMFLTSFAVAEENHVNLRSDAKMMGMMAQESIDLSFDPDL